MAIDAAILESLQPDGPITLRFYTGRALQFRSATFKPWHRICRTQPVVRPMWCVELQARGDRADPRTDLQHRGAIGGQIATRHLFCTSGCTGASPQRSRTLVFVPNRGNDGPRTEKRGTVSVLSTSNSR